jgi:hypothetical protein
VDSVPGPTISFTSGQDANAEFGRLRVPFSS